MILRKLLYHTHRISGTVFALLFLMWFVSGFVLIYKPFPSVDMGGEYKHFPALDTCSLPTPDRLTGMFSGEQALGELSLSCLEGKPVFRAVAGNRTIYLRGNDFFNRPEGILSLSTIRAFAHRQNTGPVIRIDTLRKLEQWIPFAHYRNDFPIYKISFGDAQSSILYLSSQTGKALQYCTRSERLWAYSGAIPHWVYLTGLRSNPPVWRALLGWLAGIGSIVCLSGIVIGVRVVYRIRRRTGRWRTPYKKNDYKWHHILGLVFGLFVFLFIFSGMMSVVKIPQWIIKTHDKTVEQRLNEPRPICLEDYKADYRQLITLHPDSVRRVEWLSFGKVPLYRVVTGTRIRYFNASRATAEPLDLKPTDIEKYLSAITPGKFRIEQLFEHDNYYIGSARKAPLPVYRVVVDDHDGSTYYVNPHTGAVRYFNRSMKVRKWIYPALHSLRIKYFMERPVLWNIVMYTAMIGGSLVTLTSISLSVRYLRRKLRRKSLR